MKIDSAFIENRMEDLQNNKNKTTTWSLLGIYPKEWKSLSQRDIYTPMFTAALVTIAKIWKQAKVWTVECIKKMWFTYVQNRILFHLKKKKEGNSDICDNMDD